MTISHREYSHPHRPFAPGCRALAAAAAFTLIELLVVIAIIGILAGFLMPAMSKGKLASLEAASVHQLRELQMMNTQYAADNNQYYVPVYDPVSNDLWLNNPNFLKYYDAGVNQWNQWWGNSPAVLYSPLVSTTFSQSIGSSYGVNSDNLGWPPINRRMADVPHPSQMIAFTESDSWIITQAGATTYTTPEVSQSCTVAYRYNNMTNGVFYDGHVETLTMKQVANNTMLWDGQ